VSRLSSSVAFGHPMHRGRARRDNERLRCDASAASAGRRTGQRGFSRTGFFSVALAFLVAGCHGPRPAVVPATPLSSIQRLQLDIDAILQAPALTHGAWGVLVQSLSRNDTLCAVNARKLMLPASNLKIFTLAAAAQVLGWNYTYETHLVATAGIDDGGIDGDLIVSSTGDPSLSEDNGLGPRLFELWADRLKTLGVRTISGRIVGDDNAFDDEIRQASERCRSIRTLPISRSRRDRSLEAQRSCCSPRKGPG
jgi:D-alanyl-D-alanine carboxypeptidase